jgi:hypothetical protein
MDNEHDHRTRHPKPMKRSEAELLAMMEQADRDVASGQTVPLADVLAEMDGVIEEIEANRRARQA